MKRKWLDPQFNWCFSSRGRWRPRTCSYIPARAPGLWVEVTHTQTELCIVRLEAAIRSHHIQTRWFKRIVVRELYSSDVPSSRICRLRRALYDKVPAVRDKNNESDFNEQSISNNFRSYTTKYEAMQHSSHSHSKRTLFSCPSHSPVCDVLLIHMH